MRRLSGDEFGRLFETFQSNARRVETLQEYSSDEETEMLALWRAGHPVPPHEGWCATIRAANQRGATIQRVRLIVPPLSEYVRFELAAYQGSARAGESIRILEVGPNHPSLGHDVWVFDYRIAVRMVYDDAGRFLHGQEEPVTDELLRTLEGLITSATPLARYLAGLKVRS